MGARIVNKNNEGDLFGSKNFPNHREMLRNPFNHEITKRENVDKKGVKRK
jgi:hypothetical protein